MKPTVYIETTIPSYLVSRPSALVIIAGEQEITRRWWEKRAGDCQLFRSQLVLSEISRGDADAAASRLALVKNLPLLAMDEKVDELAEVIKNAGVMPDKASADVIHVALAARHGIDILITWNCRHIANAQIMRKLGEIIEKAGYQMPVICTPYQLLGEFVDVQE